MFFLEAEDYSGAKYLYSVIETAKRCGLEPFAYLRLVLTELPGVTTLDDVETLLPRHVDPARLQGAGQFSPVR